MWMNFFCMHVGAWFQQFMWVLVNMSQDQNKGIISNYTHFKLNAKCLKDRTLI